MLLPMLLNSFDYRTLYLPQVARIVGSNYSGFQYWVAILPSIMYFDDKALVFLFSSSSTVSKVVEAQQSCKRTAGTRIAKGESANSLPEIHWMTTEMHL